jgi:hypothetical protein
MFNSKHFICIETASCWRGVWGYIDTPPTLMCCFLCTCGQNTLYCLRRLWGSYQVGKIHILQHERNCHDTKWVSLRMLFQTPWYLATQQLIKKRVQSSSRSNSPFLCTIRIDSALPSLTSDLKQVSLTKFCTRFLFPFSTYRFGGTCRLHYQGSTMRLHIATKHKTTRNTQP